MVAHGRPTTQDQPYELYTMTEVASRKGTRPTSGCRPRALTRRCDL